MTKLYSGLLALILFFGFLFRVISIDSYPPSLNWDEVSHGYNAYSILTTGKDQWGIRLPLIFRVFGDYKLPVYIYLTVPIVSIFGLNPLSVRLVSILAGSILPFIIYLIIKKLFPKKSILSLIAASIISLSPGFIFLSRIALEANLFLTLFCLSFYFLLCHKFGLSTFIYGLCLLTYNSSRVILPFYLFLVTTLCFKNKFKPNKNWLKFIPLLFFLFITIYQTLNYSGQARYQWVSILDSGSLNRINELRQLYPRIIINKATYFTFTAIKNYLSHFDPRFLFISGGSNYQFSLPQFFIISILFLPFFILGLFNLFKNLQNDHFKILLFWLLISPIPSSITRDAPHVLRSIVFLPIMVIVIILGFNHLANKYRHISLIYSFLALILGQFLFWPKYKAYAVNYSSSWQFGYQETVNYIKENYHRYDQIIFTKKYGEPHEFILFYWPWLPSKYQSNQNLKWDFHSNWYWVNSFDKFIFVNDWEIKEITQNLPTNKKILLITSPGNYNQNNHLIKTINFLDNTPAFQILEINP